VAVAEPGFAQPRSQRIFRANCHAVFSEFRRWGPVVLVERLSDLVGLGCSVAGDFGLSGLAFGDKVGLEAEYAGDGVQGGDGGVVLARFDLAQGLNADAAVPGEFGLRQAADVAHGNHDLGALK